MNTLYIKPFLFFVFLYLSISSCRAIDGDAIVIDVDVVNDIKWDYFHYKSENDSLRAYERGKIFSEELINYINDFKKEGDLMVHVSTFCIIRDTIYLTYYANRITTNEEPSQQLARFVICPLNDPDNKMYYDLQGAANSGLSNDKTVYDGKLVTSLYDTILLKKDDNVLYLMWTAALDGVYTRLYQPYYITIGQFGDIGYNHFRVKDYVGIMDVNCIEEGLNLYGIKHKPLEADIGIMQKISTRIENGHIMYYTGCYANTFNCIIKSQDLITWEYVSTPDFENKSQFENAVYVKGDRIFYLCRQEPTEGFVFLTYYDITKDRWHDNPLLIYDCQSRCDFIEYKNSLYAIHAPLNRNHLGIIKVDTNTINNSQEIQVAEIPGYYYPYMLEYNNKLYISFTNKRKAINLSTFTIREGE